MKEPKEYKLGIYTYYYDRQTRAWWAIPMGPRGQKGHALHAYTKHEIVCAIINQETAKKKVAK